VRCQHVRIGRARRSYPDLKQCRVRLPQEQ
jgi:hypothetical protein